jgi:hypothetical protein
MTQDKAPPSVVGARTSDQSQSNRKVGAGRGAAKIGPAVRGSDSVSSVGAIAMADKEIIAAILAAGMLPPVAAADIGRNGQLEEVEQQRLMRAIGHAIGLYRGVFEGLNIRTEDELKVTPP